MTKAELITDLQSIYTAVGSPFVVVSGDSHVPTSITHYSVAVYETGLSEINKKPVIDQKNVSFCVYNDGLPEEAAYYAGKEQINDVNTDLTGANTLSSIHKVYISEYIRGRVQAAVAKASQDILNETPSTTARQKWATEAMLDPDAFTKVMTCFVALNPSIQAAGGLATDNDIQFVVNSNIDKLATNLLG
jgi:hypothetical protein